MVETGKSNKELFTMLEIAKILDTVRLLVTVQETVCSTVYSLRLCHKGVVWRGELGSPPSIQKVIWIHYDFQIGFKLEFIF